METLIQLLAAALKLKVIWVIVALIALYVYRYLKMKYEFRKFRRTETLTNLKEYFDLPKENQKIFLKELLFEDHFGKQLSWREISFFFNSIEPIRFLRMYMESNQYLRVEYESFCLIPKGKYSLRKISLIYLSVYFIMGFIALMMLFSGPQIFTLAGLQIYAVWSMVLMIFFVIASVTIHESLFAHTALKLIDEFEALDREASD